MQPLVDHIQITVKDLSESEPFYDKLLPILGFDLSKKSKGRVEANDFDVIEYVHANITIGINSPRESLKNEALHRRKPGALHHLAFKANSEAEVDEAYQQIKNLGANIVDAPKLYPQHGAHYYALFFKDPSGIKYEIMFEQN
ncbi:MAG: catechol 2,3-dioxygenase-like lactoylglutathione lyase family enzyme [Bacteroidia bacterium]|jgi:catechol 2,3-dioxygenase-like lactoylglutathione lyase family enzyme